MSKLTKVVKTKAKGKRGQNVKLKERKSQAKQLRNNKLQLGQLRSLKFSQVSQSSSKKRMTLKTKDKKKNSSPKLKVFNRKINKYLLRSNMESFNSVKYHDSRTFNVKGKFTSQKPSQHKKKKMIKKKLITEFLNKAEKKKSKNNTISTYIKSLLQKNNFTKHKKRYQKLDSYSHFKSNHKDSTNLSQNSKKKYFNTLRDNLSPKVKKEKTKSISNTHYLKEKHNSPERVLPEKFYNLVHFGLNSEKGKKGEQFRGKQMDEYNYFSMKNEKKKKKKK